MSSPLLGLSYLGFARGRPGAYSWQSFNTTTWNHLPEFFHSATAEDVATAGHLAAEAAPVLAALSGAAKAAFLRDIAVRIEAANSRAAAASVSESRPANAMVNRSPGPPVAKLARIPGMSANCARTAFSNSELVRWRSSLKVNVMLTLRTSGKLTPPPIDSPPSPPMMVKKRSI